MEHAQTKMRAEARAAFFDAIRLCVRARRLGKDVHGHAKHDGLGKEIIVEVCVESDDGPAWIVVGQYVGFERCPPFSVRSDSLCLEWGISKLTLARESQSTLLQAMLPFGMQHRRPILLATNYPARFDACGWWRQLCWVLPERCARPQTGTLRTLQCKQSYLFLKENRIYKSVA